MSFEGSVEFRTINMQTEAAHSPGQVVLRKGLIKFNIF